MGRKRSFLRSISTGSDRSASPAVGIILMVAVTVVIAAGIGATVLGLGGSITESPPQATLEADQTTVEVDPEPADNPAKMYTAVTISHESGDDIEKSNIRITVNGEPGYSTPLPPSDFYSVTNSDYPDVINPWDTVNSDSITAGDDTTIIIKTSEVEERDQILGRDPVRFDHWTGAPAPVSDPSIYFANSNTFINKDEVELTSDDTVRMIWESGDESVELFEYTVS